MKCDLVIGNGELGLIDHDYNKGEPAGNWLKGIPVKRLSKGYTSVFDPDNVLYVDVPVIKKGKNK